MESQMYDCRICLESAPRDQLVEPCECSGTSAFVHVECLERWVVERGSCRCEVCKAPYADSALTPHGRRRIAEMERLRLEWPQHRDEDEALMLHPPTLASPATRRLLFLSSISLLAVIFVLAQDDGATLGPHSRPELTDLEAERYMVELGLLSLSYRSPAMALAPAPASVPAVPPLSSTWEGVDPAIDAGDRSSDGPLTLNVEDTPRWPGAGGMGGGIGGGGAYAYEGERSRRERAELETGHAVGAGLWSPDAIALPWWRHSWSSPAPPPPRRSRENGGGGGALAEDGPPGLGRGESAEEPSNWPRDAVHAAFAYAGEVGGLVTGGGSDGGASGGSLAGGGPLPPLGPPVNEASPPPPARMEALLEQLIIDEGCDEEARTASSPPPAPPGEEVPEGARGLAWRETSRCERAGLVLHHVRLRHAMEREKHAEQAAGEAMGRLMRAFVLLCLLRIILAQQQRRRMLIDRDRAPTWDRAVNV